jgi:hypothetical protein
VALADEARYPAPIRRHPPYPRSDPKIIAAKAGKRRFTMFHGGGDIWIIHRHDPKGKRKLDRVGMGIIQTMVLAIADYEQRVKDGKYYERD